jgi:hypothetical protein
MRVERHDDVGILLIRHDQAIVLSDVAYRPASEVQLNMHNPAEPCSMP